MTHIYTEPLSLFFVGSSLLLAGWILRHKRASHHTLVPALVDSCTGILAPLKGVTARGTSPGVLLSHLTDASI